MVGCETETKDFLGRSEKDFRGAGDVNTVLREEVSKFQKMKPEATGNPVENPEFSTN